jgi:hypothetical protein
MKQGNVIAYVSVIALLITILTFLFGPSVIEKLTKDRIEFRVEENYFELPGGLSSVNHTLDSLGLKLPNTDVVVDLRNMSNKVCVEPNLKIDFSEPATDYSILTADEAIKSITIEPDSTKREYDVHLERLSAGSRLKVRFWATKSERAVFDTMRLTSLSAPGFSLQRADDRIGRLSPLVMSTMAVSALVSLIASVSTLTRYRRVMREAGAPARSMTYDYQRFKTIDISSLFNARHDTLFTGGACLLEWFKTTPFVFNQRIPFAVRIDGMNACVFEPKGEISKTIFKIGTRGNVIHMLATASWFPKEEQTMVICYSDGTREPHKLMIGDIDEKINMGRHAARFPTNQPLQQTSKIMGVVQYLSISVDNFTAEIDSIEITDHEKEPQIAVFAITVEGETS